MTDINHVVLVGRVCKDAELKNERCDFSIAFNTTKKDGSNYTDESNFLNLSLWGKRASALAPKLIKGKQVVISGHLKINKWEKDGKTNYSTNVVIDEIQIVGGSKSESNNAMPSSNNPGYYADEDFTF